MENEEIKRNRKLLAEVLKNEELDVSTEIISTNDCVKDDLTKASYFIPRNRGGDWYYVEDSLNHPCIVKFINRYLTTRGIMNDTQE